MKDGVSKVFTLDEALEKYGDELDFPERRRMPIGKGARGEVATQEGIETYHFDSEDNLPLTWQRNLNSKNIHLEVINENDIPTPQRRGSDFSNYRF